MKKKRFRNKIVGSNAVEPASLASAFGKGCAGKGGKTTNVDLDMKIAECIKIVKETRGKSNA